MKKITLHSALACALGITLVTVLATDAQAGIKERLIGYNGYLDVCERAILDSGVDKSFPVCATAIRDTTDFVLSLPDRPRLDHIHEIRDLEERIGVLLLWIADPVK